MDFGQKILFFRKQKGLSQEDLANKIGVTRQAVSRWELEIAKPDIEKLYKIAFALEININQLLEDKEIEKEKIYLTKKVFLYGVILICLVILICSLVIIAIIFNLNSDYILNSKIDIGDIIGWLFIYNNKTIYLVWRTVFWILFLLNALFIIKFIKVRKKMIIYRR